MRKMVEKFQSLFPDKNKRVAIYFIFYFVFFFILFIFIIWGNFNKKEECPEKEDQNIVDTKNNYGFRYEIDMNGSEIVLSGSRYDDREKIDKRVEGLLTKYYIYYSDIYVLNEKNEWVKYDGKIVDNFDNKLLNIDYINELISTGEIKKSSSKKYVYYNEDKDITIEKHLTDLGGFDYIKVIDGTTSVILRYFDEGKIEEIDIETKE
jgi:hypothetical protein